MMFPGNTFQFLRKSRCLLGFIITLLGSLPCLGAADSDLKDLDRIVANHQRYEAIKREEINKARAEYENAKSDSDRYNALRGLYEEYRSFRIDSALIVSDTRLAIARRMGIETKIASASLNLAESYVKSGLADEALHILDTISTDKLEDYHIKYRNSIYSNAYSLKSKTALLPADRIAALEQLRKLREETLDTRDKETRGYYTLRAEQLKDAGMFQEAVAMIEEAHRKFDFSNDAAMQYTMGEIYLAAGQKEKAKSALINAARIDLSSGVKEYRALILLASLLFDEGDVKRAFEYINCAFEDSHFSNASLRAPEIMAYMPVIDQAFHAYEQENSRRTKIFLWITVVMVIVLAGITGLLWRTLKANRRMMKEISKFNDRLADRNRKLMEADSLKLSHINNLMLSNAKYIARIKEYRKSIYRLMKTGQYEKAMDTLKSDRSDSKDIAAFHEMFDEAFLSMFPDFISSVNRLLKQPIELKDPNHLTPELRIMALMRLGMSSTEEISGILHYSSQTVYNLRSSIRNLTDLPKEELEKAIRKI